MLKASIDIGSNSVLLLACEFTDKIEKEVLNLSHITSLGKNLDKTGEFQIESMEATFLALENYKQELEKINYNVADTIVTATEAARVAKNAGSFFKRIKEELGFNIQIISGEEEAYYTALGVLSGFQSGQDNCVIMDIGGASTEFIRLNIKEKKIESSISLPVGSVRATDWIREDIFKNKMEKILENDLSIYETPILICVAGSMTSLASMFLGKKVFNDKEIDGLKISFHEFIKFSDALMQTNKEELLLNFPFLGKRAEMVAGGAKVATLLAKKLNIEEIQISTRGLRYGVLVQGLKR